MDTVAARTFLTIVETGSFKAAAERLNVTQSTVSARIRSLEEALGRTLLERSKAGVAMTPAGEQFHRHATAIVRIWRHAQLDVGLADYHQASVTVGAQISLWDGLLLRWLGRMREDMPEIAMTAEVGSSQELIEQLVEGSLDLAVVYRGAQRPGIVLEHIFDEELALVSNCAGPGAQDTAGREYVFVNWGPEFAADHAETYPDRVHAGLRLNLGAIGITHLIETQAAGYFPLRIAKPFLDDGRLVLARHARRFVYPVYAAYPEDRDEAVFGPMLTRLREVARQAEVRLPGGS